MWLAASQCRGGRLALSARREQEQEDARQLQCGARMRCATQRWCNIIRCSSAVQTKAAPPFTSAKSAATDGMKITDIRKLFATGAKTNRRLTSQSGRSHLTT